MLFFFVTLIKICSILTRPASFLGEDLGSQIWDFSPKPRPGSVVGVMMANFRLCHPGGSAKKNLLLDLLIPILTLQIPGIQAGNDSGNAVGVVSSSFPGV